MKKIMILAASAALVLAGCAKIETVSTQEMDAPVGFSAYSGNPLTKAGSYDVMTIENLQASGFGVFAYQTTGNYAAGIAPNFMYNQHVEYSSSAWTYSPIKYWPNQINGTAPSTNGNADGQDPKAQSYSTDKVSFFAYAPYVAATANTGAVTPTAEGITALTSNEATTDPKVSYKVSTDLTKQVDLLWGVSNGTTWNNVAGGTNTPTQYLPYLNLQKPAIGTSIHFYFYHALAQLRVRAIAAINSVPAGDASTPGSREQNEGDNITKILIEKVEITSADLNETGDLNLNNTETVGTPASAPKAKWENLVAFGGEQGLTIQSPNINTKLYGNGTSFPAGTSVPGVIYKASSANDADADVDVIKDSKYYTLIPVTPTAPAKVTFNVKVTYHVVTKDTNLAAGYSSVKNVISHDVKFDSLDAGKRYTIKMILGISEVKFEASVENWVDGTESTVDLPKNS